MARKSLWNLAKEKIMKERGELPKEEQNAMHEEDFWSSWLREDERGKEERRVRNGDGQKKM